jgi:ferrous iron transport protein B
MTTVASTVALVGNPNCGKTTLFNSLTGRHQRVGNWPGVTVEKKVGTFTLQDSTKASIELVDLPGTYSLNATKDNLDEVIAQNFIGACEADLLINILDASSLARGLYLTHGLLKTQQPMIVVVNMLDVAKDYGLELDLEKLSAELGCPVIGMVAAKGEGVDALKACIAQIIANTPKPSVINPAESKEQTDIDIYGQIDALLVSTTRQTAQPRSHTEVIDSIVMHRILAFPIFLGVMYLMFMISINVGSAFIDFFDLFGSALFVELPRQLLDAIGSPQWLTVFLADGVGGGVQLVGTFIPVIGALFLVLSVLEDSGYMARIAFIVDRLLKSMGLAGKSFVPLIVGFGCNVPAVMATRALDGQSDRILTILMAPYMSCGARLTVYALFATAFFPSNGQNVVFALYLTGIVLAVLSALAVKKHLLPQTQSAFVMELPPYHAPILKNILIQTWQRLKGFVLRAGKAIVVVVIALNILNSIGTDGSVGNENTENSVLSAVGKSITPVFSPMGISPDNWPATVGIFTGIFAKEVVVGTLDALYTPGAGDTDATIPELFQAAFASVPDNLLGLTDQLSDPLGLNLGDLQDLDSQVDSQNVQISTVQAMQSLFDGRIGAFAYLLFVLLYMPCVATIGVIFKEAGGFWASFSVIWSFALAYSCAVITYQLGTYNQHPASSIGWIIGLLLATCLMFWLLVRWGQKTQPELIPLLHVE